jgi:hypothetical protein
LLNELDLEAESLDTTDEPPCGGDFVAAIAEVSGELAIRFSPFEHVVGGGQHGAGDGEIAFLLELEARLTEA